MPVMWVPWTNSAALEVRNMYKYILDLRNKLEEACKLARENLQAAKGENKHHYDQKTRQRSFEVGHKVVV